MEKGEKRKEAERGRINWGGAGGGGQVGGGGALGDKGGVARRRLAPQLLAQLAVGGFPGAAAASGPRATRGERT